MIVALGFEREFEKNDASYERLHPHQKYRRRMLRWLQRHVPKLMGRSALSCATG